MGDRCRQAQLRSLQVRANLFRKPFYIRVRIQRNTSAPVYRGLFVSLIMNAVENHRFARGHPAGWVTTVVNRFTNTTFGRARLRPGLRTRSKALRHRPIRLYYAFREATQSFL